MKKIAIFLLFFINLSFCNDFKMDTNITHNSLENGLEYYILKNEIPKNSVLLYLDIKSGSAHENDNEQGLAHFVEHMAFNGSEHFNKNELIRTLEDLGVRFGADLNAATSAIFTTYNIQMNVSDENLQKAFLVFSDYLNGLKFDENEIEKEKGIILEEAKKDLNTRLYEQEAGYFFDGSIFKKRFPIGKNEIIASANKDLLLNFYKRRYQPKLASIVVVGDIEPKKIEKMIIDKFSKFTNSNLENTPDLSMKPIKSGILNVYDKENKTSAIRVVFNDKFMPLNSKNALKIKMLDSFISILLNLSHEKQNINSLNPIKLSFDTTNLFGKIKVNTFNANVLKNDFKTSLETLFATIKGIRKFGFNKDDFESVKKDFLSQNEAKYLQNENSASQSFDILKQIHYGDIKLSKDDKFKFNKEILENLSLDEVNAYFKKITQNIENSEFLTEFISQEKIDFSEDKVNKIYQNTKSYNFAKNIETKKVLLDKIPQKKAILNEKFDKKNQIYEFSFENGVKVTLKDVKTIKNQIRLSAVKKGGYDNYENNKAPQIAFSVLNSGTIGDFNEYEVKKITSGAYYQLKSNISQNYVNIVGMSNDADFEMMLQELFVIFSNPKLHKTSFEKFKQNAINSLQNRNKTSEYKFTKEILTALYNNSRAFPLEISDINNANLANLQKIVNEIFANGSDFNFVISGDLNIEKIKNLTQIYLANLNTNKIKSDFKDDGVRAINGEKSLIRNYGDSDKSEIKIVLNNDNLNEFLVQKLRIFNVFQSVLKMQILEKIRENNSWIYSVSINGELSKIPYNHAYLTISTSCKKEFANDVINAIKDILIQMQKNGVSDEFLNRTKKAMILEAKRSIENSNFWLTNLQNHTLLDYPIFDINEYEKNINSITNDDIKAILNDINVGNFFSAILNPQK